MEHKVERIKQWRQSNWLFFILTSLLFGIHVATSRFQELFYDAQNYWKLAANFYKDDGFSLYHFDSPLRGYLLPLLYYPMAVWVREVAPTSQMILVKIVGAGLAGLLFGVVGPLLWQQTTNNAPTAGRRALFVALGFIFWRDYFNFLLSDFPGLLALLLALLAAGRVRPQWWTGLATGAGVAAALYIRPIYALVVPFVAALLLVAPPVPAGRPELRGRKKLLFFSVGLVLLALPQYLINQNNFQSQSPLILGESSHNEYLIGGKNNLYLWQLNNGLTVQRYETNVGTTYPDGQVFFSDPAGAALRKLNVDQVLDTYGKYFYFVGQHPFDMVALYARHLFNGLDLLYTSPYIYNIYGVTLPLALLNYTVLFAALLVVALRRYRVGRRQGLVLGALLITCLATIPTIVEGRFFLPLHLLLYAVVCFGWPDTGRARQWWKHLPVNRRTALVVAYGAFLLLCLTLSSNTQANLAGGTKLVQSGL